MQTQMASYVNLHADLEGRRNRAKASANYFSSQGPRVIVLGVPGPGKITLSRILLSLAAKQGWKPSFVDLDIGQGSITVPGCIAATPVVLPIDPVEGIPLEKSLVYFYGHPSPCANLELYKVVVKELAQTLLRQFSENAELRASGMVINTMGWLEGLGYKLLVHAIDTFKATVVLVLGQEKLCSMLGGDLRRQGNVDVVMLEQSGGVLSADNKVRQKARESRIREYFYGLTNDLSPHTNIVNFTELSIYRVGGPHSPRSSDVTRLSPVTINRDLLHLVLGVSYAKEPDDIVFRGKITYLAPCPGELPGKNLVVGNVNWVET